MERLLFKPDKIDLPPNLVLIPQFWDTGYFKQLKEKASGSFQLLQSDVLLFENYTVIVGFLGYPNILTILEFINHVKEKNIYFLGTAGSMVESINRPMALNVESIYSTAILNYFSTWKSYQMNIFRSGGLRRARGVTVDIVQRETPSWLQEQVHLGMEFVEMEIFPIRAYLDKPFHALVVTSDLLRPSGIEVFKDKKLLKEEFVSAYELIVENLSAPNGA